jgi:MraZ protein
VDEKGRFALPYPFRAQLGLESGEKFVLTKGPDSTLCLMPEPEFVESFERLRRKTLDKKGRMELRRLSNESERLTPDSQGRITVSSEAFATYGITKKILVVGMGRYLELWDPARYREQEDGLGEHDDEIMEEFFGWK